MTAPTAAVLIIAIACICASVLVTLVFNPA